MRWFVEASAIEKLLIICFVLSSALLGYLLIPGSKWPVDPKEKLLFDSKICVFDRSGNEHCEGPAD